MSKAPNVFDWDDDEESKRFEKNLIFGDSDETDTARDFLKKSMQAANMSNSFDEDAVGGGRPRGSSGGVSVRGLGNKATPRPVFEGAGRGPSIAGTGGSSGEKSATTVKEQSNATSSRAFSRLEASGSSLDEHIQRPSADHTAQDYKKLLDDLADANRTIKQLKEDKWKSIPVDALIQRVILGDSYTLDTYKSLNLKESLLQKAINSRDGNAILTVVVFLERTLSTRIFQQQLKKHTLALNHYAQYLRSTEEWRKLEQLYKDMGMIKEAAFLQYERANILRDVTPRIMELQRWLDEYREARHPDVEEIRSYIVDEVKLLEKQNQIETEDKKKELTNTVMQQQPRQCVELRPLITTISYCALYHHNKSDMFRAAELRKQFQVTDKQYEWAVLTPLVKLRAWESITELLTASGWFGKKSEMSHIGFENVVNVLVKTKADPNVIMKYCNLVSDLETRVRLGRELQLHDVVIDALFALRDKHRLEQYRSVIGDGSRLHQQRINDILHNTSVKWK